MRPTVCIIAGSMNPEATQPGDSGRSEELQALLDAAVDGIVVIDQLGGIQRFNRSAERLFGYEAGEVIGQNVGILMTGVDRCAHDGHLARYSATHVAHIIGTGREVNGKRKDGSVFPAQLAVGLVANCEPPRFVGFIHDITARRRAEEDAIRLQDRLTHVARLTTIGEMASGLAHELNQPLAAIATYAHACDRLLELPSPDLAEIQQALKEIAGQAVRAGDIIRRLRGLARTQDVKRAPCDINTVVSQLTDLIQSDAKATGVVYRLDLGADLPAVIADPGQIQQVVINLVRNALEAVALGQVDFREIVVRTRLTPESEVEICVCDNGPGVDGAIADRMFDPFCTTKATGTGLGLAISRTIMRTHEGTLSYRPNTPNGACFIAKLATSGAPFQ